MPYVVLSILLFVGLVAYLYGESAARIAVAVSMAFCSCAIMGLLYVAAMNVNKQINVKPISTIRMGYGTR